MPAWGGEQRTWDIPLKLKLPTGEEIQAFVKPDTTVLSGGKEIGTYDSATGQYTPKPMTVGEQFGGALKTAGMKALEWGFKPFELFEEYVAKPFGILAAAPFTPTVEGAERMDWWERERKEYEEWKEPVLFRLPSGYEVKPTKGLLELIPWFAIPPAARVASLLGKAGKVGQLAAKGIMPAVKAEEFLGKIVTVPIKVAGKVVKKVFVAKDFKLASPTPTGILLEETRQLHPNLLAPKRWLFTTKQAERAKIERGWNEAQMAADVIKRNDALTGNSEVQRLAATVNRLGTYDDIFKLKKMPVEGKPNLPHQSKVTARWIKPIKEGDSMYLRDILEYPERYIIDNSVGGQVGKRWIEQYREGIKAVDGLRKDIVSKPFRQFVNNAPEAGRPTPSTVIAQYEPKTGRELWRQDPFTGGTKGGTLPFEKPRVYKGPNSQKRSIELGHEYLDDPMQSLSFYAKGVYNLSSFERQMAILKIPTETVAERMERLGGEVAERMKQIETDIKYLGGGLTKFTKEGKEIIRRERGVKSLVNSILRGEIPSAATVGALERRFPELGAKLRGALDISVPELEQAVKGITKEIWAKTKITREKFMEALQSVRSERRVAGLPVSEKTILSGELTDTLTKLRVKDAESIKLLTKIYQNAYKLPKAERKDALTSLLQDVKGEIAGLKVERKVASPAYRKAREAALHAAAAEGRILNLPGWMSIIIPKKTEWGITGRQIADNMMKRFTPEKVNPIVSKASTVARVGVTLIAALDASLIFIQGPLALGHDLQKWATFQKSNAFFNMTKGLIKGIWNPKYQDALIAKEAGILGRYAPEGLVTSKAVDYLQPEIIKTAFDKWGKIGGYFGKAFGQTYGRFGTGFGSGSLAARINIIKYGEQSFLKAGWTPRQIAEYANKITGVISPEALGVKATTQALLSAGLFSPNYTRAYMMVMADALRSGLTANEVRKSLAGMLAGGFLGYVGLCEMVGQEPKLNPAPKSLGGDGAEFMAFKIGDSIIGMPGFWYSAIRMMAAVAAAAEQDPERLLSLNWRENDFLRFWMGRTSPLVHLGNEILTQKDFMGRNLDAPEDWIVPLGSHFMTIAAQNLITRHPSEEEGKFKRFGAELFGLRAYPRGDWDKLRDMKAEYSQKDFGKPFEELNLEEKDKLLEAHPDYKEFLEEAKDRIVLESGEDVEVQLWSTRKVADAIYRGGVEDAAKGLVSGLIDYRTYLDAESTLRKVYKGQKWAVNYIKEQADPDAQKDLLRYLEEQAPEDKALSGYWDIYSNPSVSRETGLIDWDATERRQDVFLATLDTETREYVGRNKDRWVKDLPPTARQLAEIQVQGRDVVDEYYDQPEGKARLAYRRANPTVDAWLMVMGRVSVPQTPMAMQVALQILREKGLPERILAGTAGEVAETPPASWGQPSPTRSPWTIRKPK